ncbi:ATP-binding cassette sub-family G member 3 [Apodemus speciosus]|uniref:ATP-binding cassette sub-family G member 3 n=1 Tax=Apodemus speciosus TaxID=105296 RepID=A0ABQ0ESJ9_APOSI
MALGRLDYLVYSWCNGPLVGSLSWKMDLRGQYMYRSSRVCPGGQSKQEIGIEGRVYPGYFRCSKSDEGRQVRVRTSVKDFFAMAFTIMMLAYSASSLSLSLGAGENVAAIRTLLVIIYFVFMLCFAGLSLDTDFLHVLSWIRYISIPHYGFRALLHNEFLGQNFCPEQNTEEVSRCQNFVM